MARDSSGEELCSGCGATVASEMAKVMALVGNRNPHELEPLYGFISRRVDRLLDPDACIQAKISFLVNEVKGVVDPAVARLLAARGVVCLVGE